MLHSMLTIAGGIVLGVIFLHLLLIGFGIVFGALGLTMGLLGELCDYAAGKGRYFKYVPTSDIDLTAAFVPKKRAVPKQWVKVAVISEGVFLVILIVWMSFFS